MRFNAWPFVCCSPGARAAAGVRARLPPPAAGACAFVTTRWRRGCCLPLACATGGVARCCLVGAVACFTVALMQPQWGEGERACRSGSRHRRRPGRLVQHAGRGRRAEPARPGQGGRALAARGSARGRRPSPRSRDVCRTRRRACPLTRDYACSSIASRPRRRERRAPRQLDRRGAAPVARHVRRARAVLHRPDADQRRRGSRQRAVGGGACCWPRKARPEHGRHRRPGRSAPIPIARARRRATTWSTTARWSAAACAAASWSAMAEAAGGVYVPVRERRRSLERCIRSHRAQAAPRAGIATRGERRPIRTSSS